MLDRDSYFLELCPLAGKDVPGHTPGAELIGGIGRVSGVECLITASESTVKGGAISEMTAWKSGRLSDIAEHNRLPSIVARVSPRSHVPIAAIATQGLLAAGFALSNTYARLLGYAVFADWIFFALAGVALIVFRRTRPGAPRPYRTPLYPIVPLVFILAGIGIVANTFVADTANAVIGSAILAAGVPVFFVWQRAAARR